MAFVDVDGAAAADIAAARAVVVAYHAVIDQGQASSALPLFTEDARFEVRGIVLRGHAEIGDFLRAREDQADRHTVHLIANETARRAGPDEVELSAFVLLHVRGRDGTYTVDRVLDTRHVVRRTAAGWRVAGRVSRPLHAPADHEEPA